MANAVPRTETYTHGHAPATLGHHARRTVEEAAAFMLADLSPGMSLVDVGCGPGSITRGFATRLAPGRVVGVDQAPDAIRAAREDAATHGVTNIEYVLASAYALPCGPGEFDAAYAHQVLQHLADPHAALEEMCRVVKPSGLIAVRDVDWGTVAYWPRHPAIDRFIDVHHTTWRRNGGDPWMGRRLRSLALAMGLDEVQTSATLWCYTSPDDVRTWGHAYADRLLTSPMGAQPVALGLATPDDIAAMAAAFREWATQPDAFWAFTHVAVRARRPRA